MVGPASATDNAVVRYDTTTGKLIQDSTVLITDGASPAIQLGGATASFPMFARLSAAVELKLADSSTYTDINLGGINAFGGVTFQAGVTMSGLPTEDPASAGVVWNNLGILTVSSG